jgi:N-acyl-L-homoserine lactone synthetase
MLNTTINQKPYAGNLHHAGTLRVQVADTPELILAAKNLCHDVYLQVGYIDKPLADRIIPYEFDNASTYLVAMTSQNEVVGTIRLTQGPPFKTLNVWKDSLFDSKAGLIKTALEGRSFEIGALAVNKNFSALKISFLLYNAVYFYSRLLNLDYAVISMDARALRAMQMQGWLVVQIGAPMDYFGSITIPGIMPVNDQPETVLQKSFSENIQVAA